jgi:cytochrome c oxidase subunit III
MWVFLATETLFFGALMFGYCVARSHYPQQFAEAGKEALLWCGSVNLGLLLTSSLSMVLAICAAASGRRRDLALWLAVTAVLGVLFLGVKGYEYWADYRDQVVPALDFILKRGEAPPSELFWTFYFVATGLHAVHLTTGIGLVLWMLWRVRRGDLTPAYYAPLEVVGLYWSFVDVVWLFLYPSIYLVGRA